MEATDTSASDAVIGEQPLLQVCCGAQAKPPYARCCQTNKLKELHEALYASHVQPSQKVYLCVDCTHKVYRCIGVDTKQPHKSCVGGISPRCRRCFENFHPAALAALSEIFAREGRLAMKTRWEHAGEGDDIVMDPVGPLPPGVPACAPAATAVGVQSVIV